MIPKSSLNCRLIHSPCLHSNILRYQNLFVCLVCNLPFTLTLFFLSPASIPPHKNGPFSARAPSQFYGPELTSSSPSLPRLLFSQVPYISLLVQDPILFALSCHLPSNLGEILQGHSCFLQLQYVLRYYFHCKHYPLSEEILRCQENSNKL